MAPQNRSQINRGYLPQMLCSIRAAVNLSKLNFSLTLSVLPGSSLRWSCDTAQSMERTKEEAAESIPPTTNERDAKSRARLIRQARKLSQVFGEMPSLDPEAVGSVRRSTSLVSTQRSRRDYHTRSRHSTGRTTANNIDSPTICSIRSFSDDNMSIISFIPSPPLSADAKLAKLNRVLGEGVPSELVFPRKADIGTPRRTGRRKSLDAETFVKPSGSIQTLKKNNSVTTPKASRLVRESVDFHQRYNQNFGSGGIYTDRQRVLNVKRARKMIQVFGRQPPKEIMLDPTSHLTISVPSPLSSSISLTSQLSSSTTTLMSLPNQEESGRRSRRISSMAQRNETSPSASNFQERRRRVAKLTRFFGVDYQDMPLHEDSCAIAGRGARGPALLADSTSATVQVEVKLGRRLWRFMDNDDKDADMDLVLDKLRALRAA